MYKDFYGLSRKPFQLSPDPSFFFASSKHKTAMSYLQYGLEQGEGFIVITGAIGTGKSTLARNLLSQIADENILTNQIVTTNLEPEELLQLVANGFGIRYQQQSKAQLLQEIKDYLSQLHKQNQRALLVIDEAQNLPVETIEELRMLSNFQLDDKPLLQSFLLGQSELRDTLQLSNMEQFRQRIIASCHIDAFDEQETGEYVLHRLRQANWIGNPGMPPESLAEIYKYTSGVPRKINILCDRLLLAGFISDFHTINKDLVNETGKDLLGEMLAGSQIASDKPVTSAELHKQTPSGQSHVAQSVEQTQEVTSTELFRQHLEEVFNFLDQTVAGKLKLLKHLEMKIESKHEQYQELLSKIEASDENS